MAVDAGTRNASIGKRSRFTHIAAALASIRTACMNALESRAPRNVLVVAMANKLARIAWACTRTTRMCFSLGAR